VRPHYDLRHLCRSANSRLLWLRGKVSSLNLENCDKWDETVAFVAIESLNVWSSFVRTYYLSWFLKPRTISGYKISCVNFFCKFDDALIFAVQLLRPQKGQVRVPTRREEPTWHDPQTLLKLASVVGVSNYNRITAALSFGATYPASLPTIRNFYAHRNKETFGKVQNMAVQLGGRFGLHPTQILCDNLPMHSKNLISEWLDEIMITVELLCI
jgi:hypothetical protein